MNLGLSEFAPYVLIGVFVLINIALWASLFSKSTHEQIDMLRKAGKTMQKPWDKEDKAFHELSDRVKRLQSSGKDIQNEDED